MHSTDNNGVEGFAYCVLVLYRFPGNADLQVINGCGLRLCGLLQC